MAPVKWRRFLRGAVLFFRDANGRLAVPNDPDAVSQRIADRIHAGRRDPVDGVGRSHPIGEVGVGCACPDVQRVVCEAHGDAVPVGHADGPLDGRALRHRQVALVALVDGWEGPCRKAGGLPAEFRERRHGKRHRHEFVRPPSIGQKPKRRARAHRGEGVAKDVVMRSFHAEAPALRLHHHGAGIRRQPPRPRG